MAIGDKRFQFHLSTALLLVLVLGGFVGANVMELPIIVSHGKPLLTGRGWPCIWKVYAHEECSKFFSPADEAAEVTGPTLYAMPLVEKGNANAELIGAVRMAFEITQNRTYRILADVAIAFVVAVAAVAMSESIIRSREARKR